MEHSTYSSSILTTKDHRLLYPNPVLPRSLPKILGLPLRHSFSSSRLSVRASSTGEAVTDSSSPGGNGGNGKFPSGGGGGGGGGEEEAWKMIDAFARALKEQEESGELSGLLICSNPIIRDRIKADPSILFKLAIETMLASFCETIEELAKRGMDLWDRSFSNVSLLDMFASYAPSCQLGFASLPRSAFGADWLVSEFPLKQKIFEHLFKAGMDGASKAASSAFKLVAKRIVASPLYKGVLLGFAFGIGYKHAAKLVMAAKVPPDLMIAALLGGALVAALNQIPGTLNEASPTNPPAAVEEERTTTPVAEKLMAGSRFPNRVYDYGVRCSHNQPYMIIGSSVNFFMDRSWFVVLCILFCLIRRC